MEQPQPTRITARKPTLDERFDAVLELHTLNVKRIDKLREEVALLQTQMRELLFWRPLGGEGRGPVMNVCEVTDAGPDGVEKRMVFTYLSGAKSEYALPGGDE